MMNDSPLYNVVGAVTAPKTFTISYRPEGVKNVLFADVKKYCEGYDIDCMVIKQGMKGNDLFEQVKSLSPDFFIVVGWYHLIPKPWLDLAPAYGLHASLLPDYSGGAPLVWAMINGEKKTGISLFQLVPGVDNGPIVGQQSIDIKPEDTIATLYADIEELGKKILIEHLPHIADGSVQPTLQDESQRRTFPPRNPEDGKIDWTLPAEKIYDFVRAQTKPYPGAFSAHGKDKVTIWSCRIDNKTMSRTLRPAEIKEADQRIFVGCGRGSVLEILHIAVNDKDVSVKEWWRKNIDSGNDLKFNI
ncbi:MAG: methionyl-tRNA formyltransferase [Nitrospinae bacterium]|nr:methionyl-tRNA formyltransferase [Nitrospinota bacterium]